MNRMFFVIGNPRSGTTLLRLMLNNHPEVTVPPECGFAMWLHEIYVNTDFSDMTSIDDFLEKLSTVKKIETWKINLAELKTFLIKNQPKNYQEIVPLIYRHYANSINNHPKWLGDKNNFYISYIETIKKLLPDSKQIYIVRDGRDVACSYKDLASKKYDSIYAPKLPSEIKEIATEWLNNNRLIKHEVDNGALLIRYEDLLHSPEVELNKVCEVLGLTYSSQLLNYHINNRIQEQEPKEFLQWKSKTLSPPDQGNIGKYRNILTKEEIQTFECIAGELLEEFGYSRVA